MSRPAWLYVCFAVDARVGKFDTSQMLGAQWFALVRRKQSLLRHCVGTISLLDTQNNKAMGCQYSIPGIYHLHHMLVAAGIASKQLVCISRPLHVDHYTTTTVYTGSRSQHVH